MIPNPSATVGGKASGMEDADVKDTARGGGD